MYMCMHEYVYMYVQNYYFIYLYFFHCFQVLYKFAYTEPCKRLTQAVGANA